MAEEDAEQIEAMKYCYSIFDKVGDMTVDACDLVHVLRSLGLNPLQEVVDKIVDDAKMKGKKVDFETFYGIYKQYTSMKHFTATYEDLVEGWACFDRDSDGHVNFAEMRNILTVLGDKMNDQQIEACIKEHLNEEGQVLYKPVIKKVMVVEKTDDD